MIYLQLFLEFLKIGLFTFGGGYAMIPMIEEQVSTHSERWGISVNSLTDFIAVSESTPGPFAINIATFIGTKADGFVGAFFATLGVILPSFLIILFIAWLFSKIMNNRFVKGALNGVKPIVVGLIISTAFFFFLKVMLFNGNELFKTDINFDRASFAILLMLLGALLLYKKKKKKSLNPILLLAISAVLGIIFFYFFQY